MVRAIEDIISQYGQDFTTDETIITVHDEDFNIICANKAAQKILALPRLDAKKVKCYKYYHGKDHPPKICPSCKCLLTKKPAIFEIFEPHLNKCIEIRAFPQFDKNDEFRGSIHFVRDTTDKRILSDKCCK